MTTGAERVAEIRAQIADSPNLMASRQRDEATGLELWQAAHYHRILNAAHISVDELGAVGRSILRWLAGWDEHTTQGLEEMLAKAYEAGKAAAS